MDKKLISIIVPVYNVENYLVQCIESILVQTYGLLEVILINDGSTDKSPLICEEYAKKDKRIKVIHKKNEGPSLARNEGLRIAKGEYIAFVDSDDWIEPDMYETLYQTIYENKADVVFGVTERDTRKGYDNCPDGKIYKLEGDQILDAYIKGEYKPHILKVVWDKLYTRKIIGQLQFKKGILGEDHQFNNIIMSRCNKVVFIGKITNHYRDIRPGNITELDISRRLFQDKIPNTLERIEILKRKNREDLVKRQTCVFYNELLEDYLKLSNSKIEEKYKLMDRVRKLIHKDKAIIRKTYRYKFYSNTYCIRMELFFLSSNLYCWIRNKLKR